VNLVADQGRCIEDGFDYSIQRVAALLRHLHPRVAHYP
jgi:hypothetical protein